MGIKPYTQKLNLNYLDPILKYPIAISDSEFRNPNLVWVINVLVPDT